MSTTAQNLRKAAVFIRSLDADTAARMLAQLAPDEANQVRAAIRTLGELDPEEQADVAAEFRRAAPLANQVAAQGVELQLSSAATSDTATPLSQLKPGAKRFDFLDEAPVEAIAQFLVREHVQTIAVVLSYLAPQRAAAILAGLPATLQADTIERLSALGDTDPDCLSVVECELSAWVAKRTSVRAGARRSDTVMSILAAADNSSRDQILVSLKTHKASLAKQLVQLLPTSREEISLPTKPAGPRNTQAEGLGARNWGLGNRPTRESVSYTPQPTAPGPQPPAPKISFDDLVLLSATELAAVLRDVDANVLVLALAGSGDELVDRICQPMPRRTAKAFRRQLSRLGPTRLSDVAAAQRIVAAAAARRLTVRKSNFVSSPT